MRINHNIAALNTYRQLTAGTAAAGKSMEKLSSGLRINRAGDDAAGLAISEKMRGQIRGLEMASKNAQDGISLIQTAEGALNETHSILQRMRELAVQASNDTNTAADREEIQKEIDQLVDEIDRIANTTEFNTKKLLNGSIGLSVSDTSIASKVSMTADTQNGTYTIDLTGATLGTRATTTAIATDASGLAQGTGILTVNGVDFAVDTTTKLEDLAADITAKVDGVEAIYDNVANTFEIRTIEVGADQTLDVSASADNLINSETWNASAVSDTGTNISGVNVDGMGANTNVAYDGNKVIVTGGNAKGLEFTANQAGAGVTVDITVGGSLNFHIGANEDQTMNVSVNAMDASNLGVSSLDVTTAVGAENAITTIDDAIQTVSAERSKLGAYQNRLEHTINNLGTSAENLTAAESRIRDVDMAKEMMEFTKNNILSQAAQAMLAQSNQMPQGVLQLLR
ncbi:MAG: flagellin protein FlaA [Bacillus sp. (in: Bacteria)]|nr:flagellin protein FlaA [Bacillus sp. (in: firmicutes)]